MDPGSNGGQRATQWIQRVQRTQQRSALALRSRTSYTRSPKAVNPTFSLEFLIFARDKLSYTRTRTEIQTKN